jgi:hypothetical protein
MGVSWIHLYFSLFSLFVLCGGIRNSKIFFFSFFLWCFGPMEILWKKSEVLQVYQSHGIDDKTRLFEIATGD